MEGFDAEHSPKSRKNTNNFKEDYTDSRSHTSNYLMQAHFGSPTSRAKGLSFKIKRPNMAAFTDQVHTLNIRTDASSVEDLRDENQLDVTTPKDSNN